MYKYNKAEINRLSLAVALVLLAILLVAGGCAEQKSAEEFRKDNIAFDMSQHKTRNVKFTAPLSLEQIIVFAMQHNLDQKVKELELQVQKEMTSQAWYKALPTLTADYKTARRSNAKGTNSVSVETGSESLTSSRSSETRTKTANLNAAWDIVDFSSSFLMALQAGDRETIAREKIRRAKQDLVYGITRNYWQCVVMGEAAAKAEIILKDVNLRSEKLGKRLADNTVPKRDGLKLQKELTLIRMRLKGYRSEWDKIKAELKQQMGLSPAVELKLSPVEIPFLTQFEKYDPAILEQEALASRPELYQQDKEEKISRNGVRLAIAAFMPALPVSLRHDHSDNPYLYANNWYTVALNSSLSILELPQKFTSFKSAKIQKQLVKERRMALSTGILAQVNLALIQYYETADMCLTNSSMAKVQDELVTISKKMADQGKKTQSEYISARIEAFFANLDYMRSYADLMGIKAQIENSVGRETQIAPQSLPVTIAQK
ncbi:MAG: TolC family protein [Planctomycetota bacterium]|jgi:outer membrane protein TolC